MNHFGIAFGAIVVAVLGGAFAFDHSLKNKEIAVPVPITAPATTAQTETPIADTTSTEKNEVPAIKLAQVTPAEPKPQAVRKSSAPAPRVKEPVEIPAPLQSVTPPAQEAAPAPAPMPTPAPAAEPSAPVPSAPAPSGEPKTE